VRRDAAATDADSLAMLQVLLESIQRIAKAGGMKTPLKERCKAQVRSKAPDRREIEFHSSHDNAKCAIIARDSAALTTSACAERGAVGIEYAVVSGVCTGQHLEKKPSDPAVLLTSSSPLSVHWQHPTEFSRRAHQATSGAGTSPFCHASTPTPEVATRLRSAGHVQCSAEREERHAEG
jgi:hypothetical protein